MILNWDCQHPDEDWHSVRITIDLQTSDMEKIADLEYSFIHLQSSLPHPPQTVPPKSQEFYNSELKILFHIFPGIISYKHALS